MTVVSYKKKGQAECCWFDSDNKERRTQFPEAALITTPAAELSDERLRARVQEELQQKSKATETK